MSTRHPSAVIAPGARIAESAQIGPYCIIEDGVTIGENSVVSSHTVIESGTTIGKNNRIHAFCSLGGAPQHRDDDGAGGELVIGDNNVIREYTTLNRGTAAGRGRTSIGDDNWLFTSSHVAHDCVIGDHVLLVNGATLGGHVEVGDHAVLGGLTLVHQFCRVGCCSFTGRFTALTQDLAPYTMATGSPTLSKGLNLVCLRRLGFSKETIDALSVAYKYRLRRHKHIEAETVAALVERHPEVKLFMDFIDAGERSRGVVRSRLR